MLTKKDLQNIKTVIVETFDQKFDEKFDQKFDQKFDEKNKPITQKLNRIQKTLDTHIKLTDIQLKDHHNRLENLEEKTGFKRPPFPAN